MKIYKPETVFEESLNRIRWVFDEFPTVVCNYSGGKDSTVILELALQVARERGRKLPVMFIDQEAEWQATIDMVSQVMYREEVEPYWLQVPIMMDNSSSTTQTQLDAWHDESRDKWMRERDPIAITENRFGTKRFHKIFHGALKELFGGDTATLSGMRTEESPARTAGLTTRNEWVYKGETWAATTDIKRNLYGFYPIYDWTYRDVWKAIYENEWPYNKVYDYMYQYGVGVRNMRVSNLHHETAVRALFILQEVEPQTYARLTKRLGGIDTAGKMGREDFYVTELPYMFSDWREYRDYLLEKLTPEIYKPVFRKCFKKLDEKYHDLPECEYISMQKVCVNSIILNDYNLTKINNFEVNTHIAGWRKWKKGKIQWEDVRDPNHRKLIPKGMTYEQWKASGK